MRISYEYSRCGMVGRRLDVRFPPLPFMSTARSWARFSGYRNAVLLIFPFPFGAYRSRVRFDLRLGGLRNSRFLPLDAEGVRSLWAPLFLWGFGLLSGGGELC